MIIESVFRMLDGFRFKGEKIFYLIEPTDENLQKYADWSRSPTESETFLGDCVSHCYRMHLREENTVFIPAGYVVKQNNSASFGAFFLHLDGFMRYIQ